ncbi:site-specific integrase [Endozoicomonas sp. SCSIO W0465]|uniref:tyrosine-type recombinase/integrase n=1 Tax=Endozoicomonas sp. SCSIO W0465 TaxID=2918516 RepID=UPI0020758154|nr:site-specific integrase [Endozoicomonas sp. SCSIO W0465]USE36903.1 site-specific integrase [Endozoicomonas sp. SCSIO W0465]
MFKCYQNECSRVTRICNVAVPGRMTVANDVLQFAKELFDYGIRLNLLQFNPARVFTCKDAGGIEEARERAIGLDELRDIFATFRKHHLQFTRDNYLNCALLLTLMCRKTELSVTKIEEFDLHKKKWTLPKDRIESMKRSSKKKPVHVPLEPEAIEWITELKYRAGYSPYLFPSRRTSKRFDHVGPDTLNTAIDKMFQQQLFPETVKHFTVHDLRRTSRTLLSKLDFDYRVAEICLGHKVMKTSEEVYNVDDFYDKRREAQRLLLDYYAPIINQGG